MRWRTALLVRRAAPSPLVSQQRRPRLAATSRRDREGRSLRVSPAGTKLLKVKIEPGAVTVRVPGPS